MRYRMGLIALLVVAAIGGGVGIGAAANRYLITSTRQIKPSVINSIVGHVPVAPLEYIEGPIVLVQPGQVEGAKAECPSYSHAVSGGGFASIAGIDSLGVASNGSYLITSNKTPIPLEIHAEVVCAPVGGAIVASAHGSLDSKFKEALAEARRH